MNIFSDSYVIRYDEASRSIHLEMSGSSTKLFEISLTVLQDLGFQEASRFLGERLLLLLPEPRRVLTGLAATVDRQQIDDAIDRVRPKSESGDSESEYRLAMLLLSRATVAGLWSDIEEAEKLLQLAASKGHDAATEYLNTTWPEIKAGYIKPESKVPGSN